MITITVTIIDFDKYKYKVASCKIEDSEVNECKEILGISFCINYCNIIIKVKKENNLYLDIVNKNFNESLEKNREYLN